MTFKYMNHLLGICLHSKCALRLSLHMLKYPDGLDKLMKPLGEKFSRLKQQIKVPLTPDIISPG